MGELAVVVTLVGVSVMIVALSLGLCRLLGGWSYFRSWLSGSTEETAVLTKSEHININGYQMKPEVNYGFDDTAYVPTDQAVVQNMQSSCPLEPQQEQTTSFIVQKTDQKSSQDNPFDDGFRSSSSPAKRAPLERGESLSARLGKGQAPKPPGDDGKIEQRGERPEPRRSSMSHPPQRSSWGRIQSQSSTESSSDFPDFIAELESGESPRLKRAISCDSVSSDTSVVLETLEDEIPANGNLEIALQYDRETNDLIVGIIQAHNLVSPDPTSATLDSFVQVFLLPDKVTNMQTRVHRKTINPVYKERFQFNVESSELQNKTISCRLFCSDKYTNTPIGQAEYKLANYDTSKSISLTLPITDTNHRIPELGEIMFSLSYLPTAERLTIVIVKARNLNWTHNKKVADPFIKVYLLQNGKKISKKKTSVKRNDKNPIYNEAMIFSVPASRLQTIQLRVTVSEYQVDGKAPSIGHVFVGTQTTGKALSHWNQMMSSLRKPIAMWHPLRK